MYRSPSQYSHAEGVGGAARGAQVTRPAARRRRPAPLPMGERRLPRFSAFVAAALLIAAVVFWWF